MNGNGLTAEDLQGALALLDDVRCEVIEAGKSIQTTSATLLRRLEEPVMPGLQGSIDEILQVVRAEKARPTPDLKKLVGVALGLALVSGSGGWYLGGAPRALQHRASLMEHVNAVLVARQSSLPADVKAALATVYTQQGFATVEQQGKKP